MANLSLDLQIQHTIEQQHKIRQLRDLIENAEMLEIGTEEVLLTKFLYYANWNVERARESIIRYYDFKKHHPDWVARHTVQYFRDHFFQTLAQFIMPKPDKNGRAIFVYKVVDVIKRFPNILMEGVEMDDLIFESLLLLPRVQKYGITIIWDIRGMTMSILKLLTPSHIRMVNLKNEVLPFSTLVVHIIQKGVIMNVCMSLLLPLLSKDIKDKIFTHDFKDLRKLQEMIGDALPAEYGGPSENQLDANTTYNYLLQHNDYLMKLQTYKIR